MGEKLPINKKYIFLNQNSLFFILKQNRYTYLLSFCRKNWTFLKKIQHTVPIIFYYKMFYCMHFLIICGYSFLITCYMHMFTKGEEFSKNSTIHIFAFLEWFFYFKDFWFFDSAQILKKNRQKEKKYDLTSFFENTSTLITYIWHMFARNI